MRRLTGWHLTPPEKQRLAGQNGVVTNTELAMKTIATKAVDKSEKLFLATDPHFSPVNAVAMMAASRRLN